MHVVTTKVAAVLLCGNPVTLRVAGVLRPDAEAPIRWVGHASAPLWSEDDVLQFRRKILWREARIAFGLLARSSPREPLRASSSPPVGLQSACFACGSGEAFWDSLFSHFWCARCLGGRFVAPQGYPTYNLGGKVNVDRVPALLGLDAPRFYRFLKTLSSNERPQVLATASRSVWYPVEWVEDWAWRLLARRAHIYWGEVGQTTALKLAPPVARDQRGSCTKGHRAVKDGGREYCVECHE